MTKAPSVDKRIQKTRSALRDTFFELVLTFSYDEITVSDIIEKANIGRSTFYKHFNSKDELLATSMDYPLTVLANSIDQNQVFDDLLWLMEHFWQNRQFAPRIFSGTSRRIVLMTLAEKLEAQLRQACVRCTYHYPIPIGIAAHQIAEAQLTVIIDWLLGKGTCSANEIAQHVKHTALVLSQLVLPKSSSI